MNQDLEFDDFKTNRQKKMTPRRKTMSWCNHCDRNIIEDGVKCEVCGSRQGPIRRRLKKESNARN